MRRVLRSLLFDVFYIAWTAAILLSLWVLLPFPRRAMQRGVRLWGEGARAGLRVLVGVRYEIRHPERLLPGAVIIACKHQSAWETMIFHALLPDPVFVLKKELTYIPFWGLYARRCDTVVVDRKAGAGALKGLVRGAKAAFAAGRPLVIFPEGTRSAPGSHQPYSPGVAGVYAQAGVPVVPVAVNSGMFWGRNALLKNPGTVVLEFLPAIPPGLERRAFLAELEDRIETATRRLEAEARGEPCGPHAPQPVDSGDGHGPAAPPMASRDHLDVDRGVETK